MIFVLSLFEKLSAKIQSYPWLLARLCELSARSTPRSGSPASHLPSSARAAFLLPPRDNRFIPILAKLDPLDSESVLRNLLKCSWKAGTERVGRRSLGTGTELMLEQELSLLSVRRRCFPNSPKPVPVGRSKWFRRKETFFCFLESRNIR